MTDETRLLRLHSILERLQLLVATTSREIDLLLSKTLIPQNSQGTQTESPRLTLRYLNGLKRARREEESQNAFLQRMYAQPSPKDELDKLKAQKAQIELERSALRLRTEKTKSEVAGEVPANPTISRSYNAHTSEPKDF